MYTEYDDDVSAAESFMTDDEVTFAQAPPVDVGPRKSLSEAQADFLRARLFAENPVCVKCHRPIASVEDAHAITRAKYLAGDGRIHGLIHRKTCFVQEIEMLARRATLMRGRR